MDSVSHVRDFLQWYRGELEEPPDFDEVPGWLDDRTPDPSQEFRETILLEDYDLNGRLYDEPPTNAEEWYDPSNALGLIEQSWRDTVSESGIEAFAWYIPFHYSTRRWGIYVAEEGLQLLGHLINEWSRDLIGPQTSEARNGDRWSPSTPSGTVVEQGSQLGESAFEILPAAFDLALEILLRHEWYHHQVELLSAYIEDIQGSLCYTGYYNSVYRTTFPTIECIEESAANSYVYRSQACSRRAPSLDVFRALFYRMTQSQPAAYQGYLDLRGTDYKKAGQRIAYLMKKADHNTSIEVQNTNNLRSLGAELPFGTALRQPRTHVSIPIYIVNPESYNLETLSKFKSIQLETDYDLIKTDQWKENYFDADEDLAMLADNTMDKLERNINLPGLNWTKCKTGYHYIRMNDQYRMIVNRNDSKKEIELIDLGHHDLPKDYGCHK
jgi:hypothetical protein